MVNYGRSDDHMAASEIYEIIDTTSESIAAADHILSELFDRLEFQIMDNQTKMLITPYSIEDGLELTFKMLMAHESYHDRRADEYLLAYEDESVCFKITF